MKILVCISEKLNTYQIGKPKEIHTETHQSQTVEGQKHRLKAIREKGTHHASGILNNINSRLFSSETMDTGKQ